jgi:Zn-dependent M28 family amino/carboxypeptidase
VFDRAEPASYDVRFQEFEYDAAEDLSTLTKVAPAPIDFAGFPAGSIALVQRGTCNFIDKVVNAAAAGAVAVIIMNEGNTPARTPLNFNPVVAGATIPVLAASFPAGDELRNGVRTVRRGRRST